MTEFEKITASPAVLGAFLGSLPCLEGPWDDAFHREFCDKCKAENGPVRTESRNPYLQQAANLRLEAMHQRDRFGRDLLARELESAAATIEELAAEMEARTHGEPGL